MGVIPESRDSDHEDVVLALSVAKARFANGDHAEAIKWLRKAADAAFDAGDDRRGIELSKTAAELKPPGVGSVRPPPPTAAAATAVTPDKPQLAALSPKPIAPPSGLPKPLHKPVLPSAAHMQSGPRTKTKPPPKKPTSQAPPGRGGKASEARSKLIEPITETPLPISSKTPIPPPPKMPTAASSRRERPEIPKQAREEDESTREFVLSDHTGSHPPPKDPGSSPSAAVTGDEWPTESVSHMAEASDFTDRMHRSEMLNPEPLPEPLPEPSPGLPVSQALRVAVSRSEQGAIVVRPLDENGLQPGEHDAMLVSLNPDDDLRGLFENPI